MHSPLLVHGQRGWAGVCWAGEGAGVPPGRRPGPVPCAWAAATPSAACRSAAGAVPATATPGAPSPFRGGPSAPGARRRRAWSAGGAAQRPAAAARRAAARPPPGSAAIWSCSRRASCSGWTCPAAAAPPGPGPKPSVCTRPHLLGAAMSGTVIDPAREAWVFFATLRIEFSKRKGKQSAHAFTSAH